MTSHLFSNLKLSEALCLLRERLRALNDPPVGFLGQRGTDACCIKRILDLIDYPLEMVICLDDTLEHRSISNHIISMEKHCGQRKKWYSPSLGKLFASQDISLPKGLILFCYSSIRQIESHCRRHGIRIVGNPYNLQHMFSNKVTLTHLLCKLGMPSVECSVHTLGSINLDAVKKQLNSDVLVFQTPLGSSGTGTFYIQNESDLKKLDKSYPPDTLFKVAKYISGPSYSVTGFVSPGSLHWLPPALQVIGSSVKGILARNSTVYSGSDFFVCGKIEKRYVDWELLERLAVHMRKAGFMGIFNVDVLARGNYVVDLNPRCPGSIRMLTELSLANNEIPFVLLALLAYLGCEITGPRNVQQFNTQAGFLVMHCLNNQTKTLGTTMQSGVFKANAENIVYERPGWVLDDFNKDQILVTGGVPQKGALIYPDAPMGRIWFKQRLVTDHWVPDQKILNLAQKVYSQYTFENNED